jgi:hypothetical protein
MDKQSKARTGAVAARNPRRAKLVRMMFIVRLSSIELANDSLLASYGEKLYRTLAAQRRDLSPVALEIGEERVHRLSRFAPVQKLPFDSVRP